MSKTSIQILGDLKVIKGGQRIAIPAGRTAQVLAALAVSAPHQVHRTVLQDAIWPHEPDASTVQGHILALRGLLGRDAIQTVGPSYFLDVDEAEVDAYLFMGHVDEGRYADAVALWKGDPGDTVGTTHQRTVIDGRVGALRAAHRRSIMELVELCMEAQDHRGATSLIERYLIEAPDDDRLDEGLMSKLAIALHFDGRRPDALKVLRDVMDGIRSELGAEPSPEVNELFQKIMSSDPALQPMQKVSLRNQGVPDDLEVVMYWGYRPAARSDIRAAMIDCSEQIVIAGQGLSTITDIVNDPVVQRAFKAKVTADDNELKITFVFAAHPVAARESEEGGRLLREKVTRGVEAIKEFRDAMVTAGQAIEIDLRTYRQGVMPRHFFLQADSTLYVGSYLSHQQGSRSYLMKLSEAGQGLYALFAAELAHVLSETTRLEIDQYPTITNESELQ
jgi:DNA-binding SARP family transcriptional activator